MKKSILLIAAFTAIAFISNGQENKTDFRDKLQFGVKVGANYSNVYSTKGEQFVADSKLGLATGVFLAIPIGKYLGFQPEVLFSQKGFQATGVILGNPYNFTRTTNYIDVPLQFVFKPSEFFTMLAGPQYSYLYKLKDEFTDGITNTEQQQEFANDNIRKNTFCFVAGCDFTMKHLVISGRAGWDLLTNNGNGTSTTPQYKNVWYQATVGYRF
jgi:hypothetical protein